MGLNVEHPTDTALLLTSAALMSWYPRMEMDMYLAWTEDDFLPLRCDGDIRVDENKVWSMDMLVSMNEGKPPFTGHMPWSRPLQIRNFIESDVK